MLWVTSKTHFVGNRLSIHKSMKSVRRVLGGQHVERRKRLVHEKHEWLGDERPREADALAHAAGEFARECRLKPVEPDDVDGGLCALARLVAFQSERVETGLDILENGEPGKQRKCLEHHRDAFGGACQGCASIENITRCRLDEPSDDAQQRGFAGTGTSE